MTSGQLIAKQLTARTTVYQCAACGTTIYSGSTRFPSTYIVRSGTFDEPNIVEPGVHLWVKRKHPWIVLPDNVPQFDEDYDINTTWPREALDRLDAANKAFSSG